MEHEAFLANDFVIDAVARNLEIIGEATRQLPEEFRRHHTEVPWTQIAGLRNRIVHDYFGLDLDHLANHPARFARTGEASPRSSELNL